MREDICSILETLLMTIKKYGRIIKYDRDLTSLRINEYSALLTNPIKISKI